MGTKAKNSLARRLGSKRRLLTMAAGILAGGALGYAYYYFIGCSSGSCAITSDPTVSTLWGAVMGGVLTSG